jgi:uncharacterized protein GlcG (DUF336 family)
MTENTFAKASITAEAAKRMIGAAEAKAREMSRPMCIAVVDGDGTLKAYTAISFGMATHEWHEFVKNDPPLRDGIIKIDRLIVFGGGYPILVDGQMVGGIGVSGGHYTHDMEVAQAGLAGL